MAKFAKIFDTPHGQLLLTKEFDDQRGFQLKTRGEDVGPAAPETLFDFGSEADRDRAFDNATQEQADASAAEMYAAITGLLGIEPEVQDDAQA